ncbi:hypothetical protein AMTRI_Chr05g62120 [Amborella trichopoda]
MNIKLQQVMLSLYALNWNDRQITSSCFIVYSRIISKTYNPYTVVYIWTSISSNFILQPHGLSKIWKLQLLVHYIHRKIFNKNIIHKTTLAIRMQYMTITRIFLPMFLIM